jgi:hypothetical protein
LKALLALSGDALLMELFIYSGSLFAETSIVNGFVLFKLLLFSGQMALPSIS